MGIMDKVMFWKHEDRDIGKGPELGLGAEHDLGLGLGAEHEAMPGAPMPGAPVAPHLEPPTEEPRPAASMMQQSGSFEKDIMLLSAKLDSLKALLDNINQRLANIERIAQESQESEKHEIY